MSLAFGVYLILAPLWTPGATTTVALWGPTTGPVILVVAMCAIRQRQTRR